MQKLYITSSCQMCCAPVIELASTAYDIGKKLEEYKAIKLSIDDVGNNFFTIIYNDEDDENDENDEDIFIVARYSTFAGGQLCDSGDAPNILILVEMKEDLPYCVGDIEKAGIRCFAFDT